MATTGRLAVESAVPGRLLSTVRTLVDPVPDDRGLALPYRLTPNAVAAVARALGLSIDPTAFHYYFEASAASDAEIPREILTGAR